jgi:ribonuclease R
VNKKQREPREPKERGSFPTRADLLAYLSEHPEATKRDLARHFDVKGGAKIALKRILRDMMDEGDVKRGRGKKLLRAGDLPEVTVVEVVAQDADGELLCRPASWEGDGEAPRIVLAPGADKDVEGAALGIGERFLARLKKNGEGFEARIIKRLGASAHKALGVFRKLGKHGGRVEPVDRKSRHEFAVAAVDTNGAEDGELVVVEPLSGRALGQPKARVRERIGRMSEPKTVSLIAIHAHGIPDHFPETVIDEAKRAKPAKLEDGRADLRKVPLVTIDPPDARDHDDAVWAEPDDDPKNKGGFKAIVAIADVSHYVRANSALDREAQRRGNSVYFPDRVVPMLPEHLSADLCSLKEKVDRAIIACHLTFDAQGRMKSHRFERALMRSAGRLSYNEVQDALDGNPNDKTGPLLGPILKPLEACYRAMTKAREKRNPIDLDLPEHKIELDAQGRVKSIALRERYDAHRLIEEFMIQANVAAAEALEAKRTPFVFRIHAPPSEEKLHALSDFLGTMNISLPKGQTVTTQMLNRILDSARSTPNADLINVIMLRSQSQAEYNPDNIGHFGLALRRYAHFTSPIRRYADLVVHRALVRAFKLGPGGLTDGEIDRLERVSQDISAFERRAMAAERDSTDRYIAAFMSDRVGAEFAGKISGVTRFGLFIRLAETGADGLVPVRSLGREFFHHDERAHALVGESSGLTFRLGDKVRVRLEEATPLTGGLRFELIEGGKAGTPVRPRGAKNSFRRGARRR